MKRSLKNITVTKTSHDVGGKRVLVAANESGCSLTQIAVTDLKAGEIAVAHIHPDMQEGFYVLRGDLDVTLDGETEHCTAEDFVYVQSGTAHELHAITDVRVLTIGCVIEAMREKLYPMLFEPNMHPVIWGGQRLMEWKQLGDENLRKQPVGESWEVSAVENSPSIVSNGTWAGYNVTEVISRRPKEILGRAVAEKYHGKMPLLAKFIDARNDLSIQVHPNDEMAMREHGKFGKSEMWYVIDAKPGAYLYAGFNELLTPDEYKAKVASGTITESLAKHEVHPGDVFYLPAGRVHAIGSGILLAEIQQSSDVTYRIFDYNRPGLDGKPRELHTDLAARALDYNVYDEYRTEYSDAPESVSKCLDTPYFSVNIVDAETRVHREMIKYDSFVIVMCTKGSCNIRARATKSEVTLREGYSCLIPAAIADYDIIPNNCEVRLLESYIDNRPPSIFRDFISSFMHSKV